MSTFNSEPVPCPTCGHVQSVLLVESANVARRPSYRAEVLDGTFMAFVCDGCGARVVVERDILYTDLAHGLFVFAFPRARRPEARSLGEFADAVFRQTVLTEPPRAVRQRFGQIEPRVVFSYDELREKVLCADHQLDDRVVEGVKHTLLSVPGSEEAGVRGLILVTVEDGPHGSLIFAQVGDAFSPEERPLLTVGREVYDDMATEQARALLAAPGMLDGPYVHRERLLAAAS
jgi:hypothetical protein